MQRVGIHILSTHVHDIIFGTISMAINVPYTHTHPGWNPPRLLQRLLCRANLQALPNTHTAGLPVNEWCTNLNYQTRPTNPTTAMPQPCLGNLGYTYPRYPAACPPDGGGPHMARELLHEVRGPSKKAQWLSKGGAGFS